MQRFYNVLYIDYGSDRQQFRDLVTKGFLTKDRADDCKEEYRQEAHAFDKLLSTYFKPGLAQTLDADKLARSDHPPPRHAAR